MFYYCVNKVPVLKFGMSISFETTGYILDRNNIITEVSGAWDTFALDNGGTEVIAKSVVGRPLFDFITGETTFMWIDVLLSYARIHDKTIERDYRCDSPGLKRYMKMTVTPGLQGFLTVTHRVMKTEPLSPTVTYIHLSDPGTGYVSRCSICSRIALRDSWTEAAEVPVTESHGKKFIVMYTVCPDCRRQLPEAGK